MSEQIFGILNAMIFFWMLSNIAAILLGYYLKESLFHSLLAKVLACFVPTLILGALLIAISLSPVGTILFLFIAMVILLFVWDF